MSDLNITQNKHRINNSDNKVSFSSGSVGSEGAIACASDKSEPYLTITNKCTNTSVDSDLKFSQVCDKLNEDFHYFERKNKYSRRFCEQFYNDPFFKKKIEEELKAQFLEESKNLYREYQVMSAVAPESLASQFNDGSLKCKYINDQNFSVYRPSNLEGNLEAKHGLNDGHLSYSMNAAFQSANRVRDLILANPEFQYFGTMTFDKKKVKSRKDAVELHRALKRFFQYLGIKFILIPERHKDGSIHFHGVFDSSIEPFLVLFVIGESRMSAFMVEAIKNGRVLYNFPKYQERFGFCDFELIQNKQAISNYVSKYIIKGFLEPQNRIFSHRFFASKGLNRPSIVQSAPSTQGLKPHYSTKIAKFSVSPYFALPHSNVSSPPACRGIGRFDRVAGPPIDRPA